MRHDRAERPPLCSQPSRMAALTYAHAAALRSAADLAHQQLIERDHSERRPRRDHPARRRLAPRRQRSQPGSPCCPPLTAPTAASRLAPPDRDSASSVVDAATIIPSTDSGVSAAIHPG